ncbi:hypothetical protein [Pseudoalteromonas agarivorans]|uniref:hypothetical protein n=1 Tax=Pseudoalteromonas agarivorans TaxID=176102 RepID=UPI0003D695AD|nr:hypothetical protein [Pseudoalteromonas agarivorans]ETJ46323.1 hypothetical protein X564_20045 [Pseudoalteromonas agarivorans]
MDRENVNTGHQNFQEKEAIKWENRFFIAFSITWIAPLVILAFQLSLVGNQINFDISKLNNWETIEVTFSLPIKVFLLMVTITTLLGVYSRSLKFSEQLRLSRLQQGLAFEQLLLAKKQAERVEEQLRLSIKKENFMLYQEHKKQFYEKLEDLLQISKSTFRLSVLSEEENVLIFKDKLYSVTFPENSPKSVENISLKSSNIIYDKDSPLLDLGLLNEVDRDMSDKQLEEKLRIFTANLSNMGIAIKFYSKKNKKFDGRVFYMDINRVITVLGSFGLIESTHKDALCESETYRLIFDKYEKVDSNLDASQE